MAASVREERRATCSPPLPSCGLFIHQRRSVAVCPIAASTLTLNLFSFFLFFFFLFVLDRVERRSR